MHICISVGHVVFSSWSSNGIQGNATLNVEVFSAKLHNFNISTYWSSVNIYHIIDEFDYFWKFLWEGLDVELLFANSNIAIWL